MDILPSFDEFVYIQKQTPAHDQPDGANSRKRTMMSEDRTPRPSDSESQTGGRRKPAGTADDPRLREALDAAEIVMAENAELLRRLA